MEEVHGELVAAAVKSAIADVAENHVHLRVETIPQYGSRAQGHQIWLDTAENESSNVWFRKKKPAASPLRQAYRAGLAVIEHPLHELLRTDLVHLHLVGAAGLPPPRFGKVAKWCQKCWRMLACSRVYRHLSLHVCIPFSSFGEIYKVN